MQHMITEAELRPTGIVDGWATWEQTGRGRAACSCGLDTDWIPKDQAAAAARDHSCPTSKVTIDVTGTDEDLVRMIRRLVRMGDPDITRAVRHAAR